MAIIYQNGDFHTQSERTLSTNRNNNDRSVSLQISFLENIDVSSTNFTSTNGIFLIKNTSDENCRLKVKLADSTEFIETIFYPGWNPELVYEIEHNASITANTLLAGS